MLLIVGLGNPGDRHVWNRHNVGFMAGDAIAKRHNFSPWRRRFQGVVGEGQVDGHRVHLLLPGTYMNESGRSVAEAMQFYQLELGDLVVIHDELDLPAGKVRVKLGGGIAGHNGLRSISSHVGNEYRRVRIGIGHPGVKELVHGYVLSDFSKAERPWVEAVTGIIAENANLIAGGKDATFQNQVHRAMVMKGFASAGEADALNLSAD